MDYWTFADFYTLLPSLSPSVTFSEIFQRHTVKLETVNVIQLLNSLSGLDAIGYGLSDFPCFRFKCVFIAQASFLWVPNHCHPVFVLKKNLFTTGPSCFSSFPITLTHLDISITHTWNVSFSSLAKYKIVLLLNCSHCLLKLVIS